MPGLRLTARVALLEFVIKHQSHRSRMRGGEKRKAHRGKNFKASLTRDFPFHRFLRKKTFVQRVTGGGREGRHGEIRHHQAQARLGTTKGRKKPHEIAVRCCTKGERRLASGQRGSEIIVIL